MPGKHANFVDIFLIKLAAELQEHRKINNHTIKFVNDQQPLYGLIYSPSPIELETLKVYNNKNLANGIIKLFKSLAVGSIFFDQKPDNSLRLYIDYHSLNYLTIKN